MATIDSLSAEAFRWNDFSNLQTLISGYLQNYLIRKGIFALTEFQDSPILDFSDYKKDFVTSADNALTGLGVFAPYCTNLTLPSLSYGVLTEGKIDLTDFKNLQTISQKTTSGGGGYQAFSGNISTLTSLRVLDMSVSNVGNTNYTTVLPTLSNNVNLTNVRLTGNGLPSIISTAKLGNISLLTQLSEFRMTYVGASTPTKAIIDNILASLKTQKQNGGAISVIDFTQSPAPTAGTSDTNYQYLIANGVTVTLGTL